MHHGIFIFDSYLREYAINKNTKTFISIETWGNMADMIIFITTHSKFAIRVEADSLLHAVSMIPSELYL